MTLGMTTEGGCTVSVTAVDPVCEGLEWHGMCLQSPPRPASVPGLIQPPTVQRSFTTGAGCGGAFLAREFNRVRNFWPSHTQQQTERPSHQTGVSDHLLAPIGSD